MQWGLKHFDFLRKHSNRLEAFDHYYALYNFVPSLYFVCLGSVTPPIIHIYKRRGKKVNEQTFNDEGIIWKRMCRWGLRGGKIGEVYIDLYRDWVARLFYFHLWSVKAAVAWGISQFTVTELVCFFCCWFTLLSSYCDLLSSLAYIYINQQSAASILSLSVGIFFLFLLIS